MEMDTRCTVDSLLFNLHEILVRDDEVILCVESFLFLGIRIVFLTIVQPFTEREDISILGGNSGFGMHCRGFVKLNWIDLED
ncbi:MAG: hypothetical protein HXS54_05695 [Theionarchaea archaeon]|nr:hypothetical protein [Theionarchaea archaeon]